MIIGLRRLGPIVIGLQLTFLGTAQKKLAALKQFFVLIVPLHLVVSTYTPRAGFSSSCAWNGNCRVVTRHGRKNSDSGRLLLGEVYLFVFTVNTYNSFVVTTFFQFKLFNPRINCLSPVQSFPLLCSVNATYSVSSMST